MADHRRLTPKHLMGLRKRLGITRGALAHELGYSSRTLQEWEQGRRRPSQTAFERWVAVLDHLTTEAADVTKEARDAAWAEVRGQRVRYLVSGVVHELYVPREEWDAARSEGERWALVDRLQREEMRLRYRRLGRFLEPQRWELVLDRRELPVLSHPELLAVHGTSGAKG